MANRKNFNIMLDPEMDKAMRKAVEENPIFTTRSQLVREAIDGYLTEIEEEKDG